MDSLAYILKWLMERGITPYMRTRDSALRKNNPLYGPDRFTYLAENNSYLCPVGQRLNFVGLNVRNRTHAYTRNGIPSAAARLDRSCFALENRLINSASLAVAVSHGLTASLAPRERLGLDLAYNFNSVIQNAIICFNDTPPPGVILPFVANAVNNDCAGNDTSNNLMANSYYTNHTNFGLAAVRFKSAKRVIANVGYGITNVDGSVPQFNTLQPFGTVQYKYQQPVANLSVDIGHKLAFNMGWNYYQYGEGSFVGPTAPRYFHANLLTESLRYSF